MRDERHYYCNEAITESNVEASGKIRFAATELVELMADNGFVPEGVCNLSSMVLVLNAIRKKNLIPKDCWSEWKSEIAADIRKAKKKEQSENGVSFHIGISPEFKKSGLYWHWLNSVYPIFRIEDIRGDVADDTVPYLLTDRSGKAIMFEHLMRFTAKNLCDIQLDDAETYSLLSDVRKFRGHPYLPDDGAFDLGIWGYPGIGTTWICQTLDGTDKITDFSNLVELTRGALAITLLTNEDGSPVKRDVSITEALLEALNGYYMAWYYRHYAENWVMAYQEAYLNSLYIDETDGESFDCNLLIDKHVKKYWEEMLHLSFCDDLLSGCNVLGERVLTDYIDFSFYYASKSIIGGKYYLSEKDKDSKTCPNSSDSGMMNDIRVKIKWNRDKFIGREDGCMELYGDYRYVESEYYYAETTGKNIVIKHNAASDKQIAEARAFFVKYKLLFAAVWENMLEPSCVQEYLRNYMSFEELRQSFEFDAEYFKDVTTFEEMESIVRRERLFYMHD